MILVDAVSLATATLDIRADTDTDTALVREITVFGAGPTHHACLFAKRVPTAPRC